jgi:undecaprenyldiphospho-muramoylpentapeptide beta-N-acetylglucosaminyltransferase
MAERTWALVAGGGTAGHLNPGLAVARALVAAGHPAEEIHFVGAARGPESELVPAAGFTVEVLPGRGIQRKLTPANIGAVFDLVRAMLKGIGIVRRRKPAVVVVLGGYASFACGVGAVVTRRPLVLLEQNAKAGAVNRVLRWFATASAVSFEGTDLPKATVTGNPLRPEIRSMAEDTDLAARKTAARAELGLPADRTVIAVFAGSLGSRRINDAVRGLAHRWKDRSDLAIRHVIGRYGFSTGDDAAPAVPPHGLVYQVVPYEDRMHLLLAAADLAVTRSGGAVFELMAAGVPAILVPLPIAPRDHQAANAAAVVAAGGAIAVVDAELDVDRLERELTDLLADPDRLRAMSSAMRAAAVVDAAEQVVHVIERVARA